MALILKSPYYSISIDGTILTVVDKTGEYEVTDNPGGWGAPNEELNAVALGCIVVRKATDADELFTNSTTRFVYDPTALNTKETSFGVNFRMDGVLDIYIMKLNVSLDGVNYLDLNPILELEYFFWDNKVWQMNGGVPVEVVDYLSLLTVSAIQKVKCTDILYPKLAVKRQVRYKDWRNQRLKNCDDAEPIYDEIHKLVEDLRGASYAFWCNQQLEAQRIIEDLLEQYQLD